jgi:hypothetical protein
MDDLRHLRARRAATKILEEGLQGRHRALRDDLHGPISEIPDPPVKGMQSRAGLDKPPEPHPLHPAGDPGLQASR